MDLLLGLGSQLWALTCLFSLRVAFWIVSQGSQKIITKRAIFVKYFSLY